MSDEYRQLRIEKAQRLTDLGVNPYPREFRDVVSAAEVLNNYQEDAPPARVNVAGRVMSVRKMGKKAGFMHLKDSSGKIQAYIRQDALGEQDFAVFDLTDLGDIVGVSGEVKKTKTGEVSVFADSYTMLTKSIQSPPEKWHGLSDPELRYRRRYVDLFSNDDVMRTFKQRAQMLRAIRSLLGGKNFLEVETPMMQPIPGGASARPFKTHHNALGMELFLRIAPELYLKRLLVGGMERVFEINRNFRNEGVSRKHNPEFTMLELYQAYGTYNDMMDIAEEIIVAAARTVHGDNLKLTYQGVGIDFTPPFARRPYMDLFEEYVGFPASDIDKVRARMKELNLPLDGRIEEEWINDLFEHYVEDKLIQPTFVIDYPTAICPLTKAHPDNPKLCDRFELFAYGFEMGNAYSELTDPVDQRRRFEKQLEMRHLEENVGTLDEDFLLAMEYGMPPAGGFGMGIDRLVMLLTDSASIRDVILFPLMRPEAGDTPPEENA